MSNILKTVKIFIKDMKILYFLLSIKHAAIKSQKKK